MSFYYLHVREGKQLDNEQSSRLNNDATYGMSREYMTFSNLYVSRHGSLTADALDGVVTPEIAISHGMTHIFVTLHPSGGMIFDKHDKSRRYLTLMTDEAGRLDLTRTSTSFEFRRKNTQVVCLMFL